MLWREARKGAIAVLWDALPVPDGTDADFAVKITDDSLVPWIKPGGTAFLRRNTELFDGDIGLFETDGGVVFRQFCADSRGAVYLFAVNRRCAEYDRVILPPESRSLVCYGRLLLKKPVPLPTD